MAKSQRQPTPQQIDAAQRILSHGHKITYGYGSKGATVRAVQIQLAAQGYDVGKFDGDWKDKTQAAYDKYMRDRGQTWGSATPKSLAFMSKEAGQPAPRQRPVHMDAASGDAMTGPPMPDALLSADATPPPAPEPMPLMPPEDPDMAQQLPDYMPPAGISPDPNRFGPRLNELGAIGPQDDPMAMSPNAMPTVAQVGHMVGEPLPLVGPPRTPPPADPQSQSTWDAIMGPVNDSYGLGLDAPVADASMPPPDQLQTALVGQGRPSYPAPNTPNSMNYDALFRALRAAGLPQMAGR